MKMDLKNFLNLIGIQEIQEKIQLFHYMRIYKFFLKMTIVNDNYFRKIF